LINALVEYEGKTLCGGCQGLVSSGSTFCRESASSGLQNVDFDDGG
jgi:hypothetical protein